MYHKYVFYALYTVSFSEQKHSQSHGEREDGRITIKKDGHQRQALSLRIQHRKLSVSINGKPL